MIKLKDDNYYQVAGWMLTKLGLKGIALNVYAIIYGFSQDGESKFCGSRQFLCDFTGATKPTIDKALNELVDKGLISKSSSIVNNVVLNSYSINPEGGKETLLGGGKETLPNNKYIYNKKRKRTKESLDFQTNLTEVDEQEPSTPLSTQLTLTQDQLVKTIHITDILEKIRNLYKKFGYSTKFHKHSTYTKLLTLLKNPSKSKRLSPQEVVYSYNAYLTQCSSKEQDVQFVKGSEVFLSNAVYDYAELTRVYYEQAMEKAYGENWKKVKFNIVND